MVNALRKDLPQNPPRPVSHAGLELNRYVKKIESGEKQDQRRLFTRLAGAPAPPLYAKAYRRWEAAVVPPNDPLVKGDVACVQDGLLVGLGAESVLETALTLHHAYGTPLIPGSALKGLARHYFGRIAALPRPDFPAYVAQLFGGADTAGYVTYYDAWYVPGSAPQDRPLKLDVLTPHHPNYNAGSAKKRTAPTDFDDPNPVPFLHARGAYLIAVRGPNPACAEFALALLLQALADYGAGGKTSSGYGRLMMRAATSATAAAPRPASVACRPTAAPSVVLPPAAPPANVSQAARPEPVSSEAPAPSSVLLRQVEGLPAGQVYARLGSLGGQWSRLPKGPERRQVGEALYKRLREANLLNNFVLSSEHWVTTLKREIGPSA